MPWNYRLLAIAFVIGVFFQLSVVLLADSPEPVWPYALFFANFDALVLIRIAFARLRAEANRGWVFYSVLCVLFVPLMALVFAGLEAVGLYAPR